MTSKKINLDGSHKQLIDLNGEVVNFNLEFVITPSDADKDKPYEIAITTQDKLDANAEIKFATIKGQFRKNLVNNSNNYQNFCLMINSDKPFKDSMQLDINIEDLGVPEPPPPQVREHFPRVQQKVSETPTKNPETDSGNKKIKYILGGLVIIVGACLLYYFWKKSQKNTPSSVVDIPTVVPSAPVVSIPAIEEVSLPKSVSDAGKPTFSFY
jgi:hypothetical protein